MRAPEVGVAAIVRDGRQRVLLVKRGHPPHADAWAFPGGHLEWGESLRAGAEREAAEETGLAVAAGRPLFVGELVPSAPSGAASHFVIVDLACEWTGAGQLEAGSDAAGVAWMTAADVEGVPLAPGMAECLGDSGVRRFLRW